MFKFSSAGPITNFNLTNVLQTIYTVPAGKILQINSILICNTGVSSDDVELWTSAQDNTHDLFPRFTLPANSRRVRRTIMTLAAGSVIKGLNYNNTTGIYVNIHGVLLAN